MRLLNEHADVVADDLASTSLTIATDVLLRAARLSCKNPYGRLGGPLAGFGMLS